MSVADISQIGTANTLNTAEFREPYRKIIRLLPRLTALLNNVNPNIPITEKRERLDRIISIIDTNLQQMRTVMGAIPESDPAFTDFPPT